MRTVNDANGLSWDVTVGKESWGTMVLLFAPRGGGEVRKAVLSSETPMDAESELDVMSEDKLRECLRAAVPW